MENGEQLTFEFEQRPTIKGFPELRWTGKRPYRSTQYYPAQLRETYGKEQNGWINKIFWGDNLQVMSHLLKEYRGQIDLIYIDPPFDSKADYKKKIEIKGVGKAVSDSSSFEEKQYGDIWTNDEYLQFMYERILLLRELLSDTGSIFLHCDDSRNFYLRCLLSEVFGEDNFHNEIIWKRSTATGLASKRCGTLHDTIYWYSKTDQYYFEMQYHEYEEDYLKRARKDENGRMYIPIPTGNPGPRPNLYYEYKGYWPHANGYKWTREKMEEFDKQGRLIFPDSPNGRIQYKQYLDEMKGTKLQDIWLDVYPVNPVAKERNGYPTQKSEALLERIIKMCAPKNGLVFDCFMGSGTTQAAAMKLGRRFIGADINLGAIQTTTKRLLSVAKELEDGQTCMESSGEIKYTGFEVYNVNNYDFFRNPVEARDLLISALEIQPFPQSDVWDGELDGRMVKIMPVNRIATKADLKELLANLPYKTYEKRKEENPNQPVERVTIVCMGHESDLKGVLEQELIEYKVDVQIVDIGPVGGPVLLKLPMLFRVGSGVRVNGSIHIVCFHVFIAPPHAVSVSCRGCEAALDVSSYPAPRTGRSWRSQTPAETGLCRPGSEACPTQPDGRTLPADHPHRGTVCPLPLWRQPAAGTDRPAGPSLPPDVGAFA